MEYDALIYQAAAALLAGALFYMAVCLKKLTVIAGKSQGIWIMPAAASVITAGALFIHIYASYVLLPALGGQINLFSSEEVIFDAEKLEAVRVKIAEIQSALLFLKTLSFSGFAAASALALAATGIYLRWISR
ncbi:MAG TPA: hypothetical protein ENN55_01070 [Firmicutes bacterium]|nr:hypothetical protein [Bacillota bacterium]